MNLRLRKDVTRKLLKSEECLDDEFNITHHTIQTSLTSIIKRYSATTSPNLAKSLAALVVLLKQANSASGPATQLEPTVDVLSLKIGERIERTIQEEMIKLSSQIKVSLAEQSKALSPPGDLAEAVTTLKQVATDMSKSINEATTATSQINDTALNYKQALLRTTSQAAHPQQTRSNCEPYEEEAGQLAFTYNTGRSGQVDPKILRDLDRKARQILIDTIDPNIAGASQAEIKEKVIDAISKISSPAPPEDTTVLEVTKLHKGGFTILFKDKEVVQWLQDPGAELKFTSELSRDAMIIKRSYSILVPRIPLTFDPANDDHLREIEECNDIPAETIAKARWIKPTNRRVPGQRAAHAIFTLRDISITNECIRDGIKVCGLHIRPSRLKHEPMQCMKCRRWGHFAHACMASADTCGTCGEEHRTSECDNKDKTFCVSCKSNSHASWDRDCPEFRRRCDQFDENYPENNLPYFPSEESWTLIPRPNRIPRPEKFPSKYAVTALQQPERADREGPPKAQNKQQKKKSTKVPPNQSTMDQYVKAGNPPKTESGNQIKPDNADAAAPVNETTLPTFNYQTPEEGVAPRGWE